MALNRHLPAPADDALFRELGGQAGIARIVGDLVPRLDTDTRLGEFATSSTCIDAAGRVGPRA
jgi:hypothetical protein